MANKAAGKGYESTDFYENVKFQFVGIENIHVMRQSLQKMIECKFDYNLMLHKFVIQFRGGVGGGGSCGERLRGLMVGTLH